MTKKEIRKSVEGGILEFVQGVNDTIIGNVSLCWHGECGPFSEAGVVVCSKEEDGRFHEVNGTWIDLGPYVTKYKHSRWFRELTNDIMEEVMKRIDRNEEDIRQDIIDDAARKAYEAGIPPYNYPLYTNIEELING